MTALLDASAEVTRLEQEYEMCVERCNVAQRERMDAAKVRDLLVTELREKYEKAK